MSTELKQAVKRKATFFATMKAVLWSFLGIRKKQGYEQDAAQLNPLHVIIAGLIAALLFVISLIAVVNYVVAK